MAAPHIVILNSGGLRSLVAAAVTLQPGEPLRPSMLFINDGRDTARLRREHARQQAEALGVRTFHELELTHLHGTTDRAAGEQALDAPVPAYAAQLLLTALAHARRTHAERIVWPAAVDADAHAVADATERAVLCGHLVDLDGAPAPPIDTPLLEFTDRQVVELGAQLGVPWRLAWSCQKRGDAPCGACGPCRRRAAAFDAAGLLDPAMAPAPAVAR